MDTQICRTCNVEQPLNDFYAYSRPRNDGTDERYRGHLRSCKRCTIKKSAKQREGESREQYLAYQKKYANDRKPARRRRSVELLQWLDSLKARPCLDCGGTFPPECMDFDHIDPATKRFTISSKVASNVASLEVIKARVLAEIEKCRLICANCHRIRTARQNGRGIMQDHD